MHVCPGAQLCSTLCDPMDCSPSGCCLSGDYRSPWWDYWSGLPFPSPGIFLTQGLNPHLLHYRQIIYHWATRQAPIISLFCDKNHDTCQFLFFCEFFSIGTVKITIELWHTKLFTSLQLASNFCLQNYSTGKQRTQFPQNLLLVRQYLHSSALSVKTYCWPLTVWPFKWKSTTGTHNYTHSRVCSIREMCDCERVDLKFSQ